MQSLTLKSLAISVGDKEVVRDFSLAIKSGEVHALMGPNGSGKSSLAYAIAGHPEYQITKGSVMLNNVNLLELLPEKRAEAGLFLSFQEPPEVGGVSMSTFLQMIASVAKDSPKDFKSMLPEIGLHDTFLQRFLNEGFSGGEKKKSELLQLIARKPKIAICDEIDSGLDLDALKSVAKILRGEAARGAGLLLISHSPRLFELLPPDFVHVLLKGKLVASRGPEFLDILAQEGYKAFS
ncbi:MAG: Fe-S cluster assembly ATPase SufC [Candidatus Sungbacteria bacterium]|nr:Fe-S cluster assembly ATPase SufC [Candidatus Sungbacteria bacterium]